ncbi:hypothetical protein HYU50_05040 [Candidatus Woesearchaeota archaeon]|nr:hypothetical protein [Candidatus Woesearchaeota archaeon]
MKLKKLVLNSVPFFLLLLLANIGNARDFTDFTATTLPSVELCPCSNQAYTVTVQNTGSVENSYTIAAAGDAAEWVKFSPSRFILQPGQAGSLNVVVNSVCNIKGNFSLEVFITTNNGLTKAIKQTLKINECYDYSLQEGNVVDGAGENVAYTEHDGPYSLCTDEQKSIPILITNNENFENQYRLLLDAPEWAKLNVEEARLGAKSSGIALVDFDTSKILGKFDFKLDAISELGKVQRKKDIEVNVEKCYELDISLEKKEVTICSGEKTEYNVVVKNSGTLKQDVKLEAEGAEWAGFENNPELKLADDEEESAALALSPEEDASGEFTITVSATPDNKTSFRVSDAINVNVVSKAACYQANINARAGITNTYKEDFFFAKVTNNGVKKANYKASVEGPSWVTVNPQALELNPGQTGNLNVELNPPNDAEPNTYGIKIILESNDAIYSKDIDIKLRKETELEKNFKAGLKAYQYYFYLLIAIIILVLIFIKPIMRAKNKIKTRYEKYKIRRERLGALRAAREKRQEERKKQKEQEEKARERQEKREAQKESQKTKRKHKALFKKYRAWVFSLIALAALVLLGHYFKLYNLRYTHIYLRNIFVGYLYYILIGVGVVAVLFLLVLLFNYISKRKKRKKKPKKETKEIAKEKIKIEEKKAEKRIKKEKRWYNKPLYIVIILALLIALITAVAYFDLFKQIRDFAALYSYYFGLGIIILIIIIGVLSFYKPAIKVKE